MVFAGILHMVVVKRDLAPGLKKPLDGGLTFRGQRLFGENKTWRGVVWMIGASALFGAILGLLAGSALEGGTLVDFRAAGGGAEGPLALVLGYGLVHGVMGLGYALGELPNSFTKRQLDITPGKVGSGFVGALFFVVDQGDSVVAALLLAKLAYGISWSAVALGSVVLTGVHLAINFALYRAKVRKNL